MLSCRASAEYIERCVQKKSNNNNVSGGRAGRGPIKAPRRITLQHFLPDSAPLPPFLPSSHPPPLPSCQAAVGYRLRWIASCYVNAQLVWQAGVAFAAQGPKTRDGAGLIGSRCLFWERLLIGISPIRNLLEQITVSDRNDPNIFPLLVCLFRSP